MKIPVFQKISPPLEGKQKLRIFLEELKTSTTTAGVIRSGEVARPASGAQLPRANQQVREQHQQQQQLCHSLLFKEPSQLNSPN